MPAHCHKLVKKIAQEAAGELYETLMSDNLLFTEWKRQHPGLGSKQLELRFVAKNWGRCLDFARATLGQMLNSELDLASKDAIMEALVLDASLQPGATVQ